MPPTPLNLKRWSMRVDNKCALCEHHMPTTFHILNGCPMALEQDRSLWKHDSVLIMKGLGKLLPSYKLCSDLEGFWALNNPLTRIYTTWVSGKNCETRYCDLKWFRCPPIQINSACPQLRKLHHWASKREVAITNYCYCFLGDLCRTFPHVWPRRFGLIYKMIALSLLHLIRL